MLILSFKYLNKINICYNLYKLRMDDLKGDLSKIESKIQKYNNKKYLLLKKHSDLNMDNTKDT